jgi:hypothetical protein
VADPHKELLIAADALACDPRDQSDQAISALSTSPRLCQLGDHGLIGHTPCAAALEASRGHNCTRGTPRPTARPACRNARRSPRQACDNRLPRPSSITTVPPLVESPRWREPATAAGSSISRCAITFAL